MCTGMVCERGLDFIELGSTKKHEAGQVWGLSTMQRDRSIHLRGQ